MIRIAARCRDSVRRKNHRAVRLDVEGLESRQLLATLNGGAWSKPIRVSYSFMPDGTSIGGVPSNLFQKMDSIAPTAVWQAQFQKAAAIWQRYAGINLAQVSDNGAALGGMGNQQNDPRYGDIRIGGNVMAMGTLGYALLPPPINGGPNAGDIVINTGQNWKITDDYYDILTVAIHEFGHALGMGHSDIVAAQMYAYYNGTKTNLNTDDIAGIQSIYPVWGDSTPTNTTLVNAQDLTPLLDAQGRVSYNGGYVTQFNDLEWYKIVVPNLTSDPMTMTITMQSTGLSSLSPRLTVVTPSMSLVGTAMASNIYGATVGTVANGVTAGQVYYIRASAANNGPGTNGAFGLLINFGDAPLSPVLPSSDPTVAQVPDGGGGFSSLSIQPTLRRHQRRFQRRLQQLAARRGHGQNHIEHQTQVVTLDNGEKAFADFLTVGPGRHPRPPRFHRGRA